MEISPSAAFAARLQPKEKKMLLRHWLPVLLLLLTGAAAHAQGTSQEDAACRPDVRRLCRGLGPEQSVVLGCLKEHAGRLSKACRKVLVDHGQL
jgi:hypothetical protein